MQQRETLHCREITRKDTELLTEIQPRKRSLVPLQLNPFTDEEAQCSLQLHKTSGYRTIIVLERH